MALYRRQIILQLFLVSNDMSPISGKGYGSKKKQATSSIAAKIG